MKVSIIVPIYNVEKYIKRCLISIINQTYSEIECILVDDSTPDNSMKIVDTILNNYQGKLTFKIIHHATNKGLSAARNTGIRHAIGDYIYLLDSDDAITPKCIENLISLAIKYKDVDSIQGNIYVFDNNYQYKYLDITSYNFPEYSNDHIWIKENMLSPRSIPLTAWNKLIRRQFIIDHDLFFKEGIIHEDEHWRFFVSKYIKDIAFCTIPSYLYYINETSIKTDKDKTRSRNDMLWIMEDCLAHLDNEEKYAQINFIFNYLYEDKIASKKCSNLSLYYHQYNLFIRRMLHKSFEWPIKMMLNIVLLPSRILKMKLMSFTFHRGLNLCKKYYSHSNILNA